MAIETRPYTDFSLLIHKTTQRERTPVIATVEVTRRCPLECAHCYNNLPMDDVAARRGEMTTEEHKLLVDQLVAEGCVWLLYTGGEIFARRDFLEIYAYARSQGLLITLFTNGTMITEKIADYLALWRPFAIEITLYGRTRETYEALTGIPGSFDKCMRGIELLMERNLPLKLKTVAVSINRHEIAGMRDFAKELGVEFKFDAMINPRVDCSHSPLEVRLSPRELVELDLEDTERLAEWKSFADDFLRPSQPKGKEENLYHCGGGVNSFAVDPAGMMSICVLSQQEGFNVREGKLHEGWNEFLRSVRDRKITRLTKCVNCHLKSICGMCPANGELENEDPEAPVDFLCEVAHLRAETFGLPVPEHGDCEYCAGGVHFTRLQETASMIQNGIRDPRQTFASVEAGPARSGCGSCGSCSPGGN